MYTYVHITFRQQLQAAEFAVRSSRASIWGIICVTIDSAAAPFSAMGLSMISPHDVLAYLKAQPFRPFRIHMVSGKTYDIRHPEMVRVTPTTLVIFTFVSDDGDIFDRWETASLTLIETISYLDPAVA
jgi:hypothetical protein